MVHGTVPGNGTRPVTWATPRETCRVMLRSGHRVVRLPCGQGCHVLHTRCVVEILARGAATPPLQKSNAEPGTRGEMH